jgi:hypothetical protein
LLPSNALAATSDTTSFWDKTLLDMELHNVRMKARTINEAWDKLGRGFLVRAVLAVEERTAVPAPFEFTREACTVREIIGAVLEAYPEYQFTQDPETGVLWIHPASVPYESILANPVVIPPGLNQVPALQGVLRPLQAQGALHIFSRGVVEAFESAHAFPVNLSPGLHAVRDILNMCCQASPSRTFYVRLDTGVVTPGDILCPPSYPGLCWPEDVPPSGTPGQSPDPKVEAKLAAVVAPEDQDLMRPFLASPGPEALRYLRPGSLRFWRLGMGRAGDAEPTHAELLQALASPSEHERWVARSFVQAETFHVPIQHIIMEAPHGREVVWASLGMLAMHNLAMPTAHAPGLLRIRLEMSRDTAAILDRGTVVLAAMEMARVGDDALLKKVAQWNLGPDELATIDPDGVRIARSSSIVRAALKEANCAWPGLSANDIRAMEEPKLQVLHQ